MRSSIVSRERVAAGDIVNQTFRVIFYWAAGSSRSMQQPNVNIPAVQHELN